MTVTIHWTCERLEGLSPRALYQALALRSQVFVLEQNCVYLDPDGLDLSQGVWHLLGHGEDGELRCCARLLAPGAKGEQQVLPMIGRVVSAPSARGGGVGRQLMNQALAECAQRWPGMAVDINAQLYLRRFYESLGFVVGSPVYDEDGIDHVDMRRRLVQPT